MSQIIQARASEKMVRKADRYFDNSLAQILVELLQNARRAGATLVTISTKLVDKDHTQIALTDNGAGIADFQKLLIYGESDWEKEVEKREDPAGMGLFSLVHSGVTVRSRGEEAVISPAAFLGEYPIETTDQIKADPEVCTTLIFNRRAGLDEIDSALKRVVKYGPMPVIFNGALLERQDFLAGAAHVKEVAGVKIGIFVDNFMYPTTNEVNFHGMVIRAPWTGTLGDILLDEKDNLLHVYVKVEVVSTSHLHLKLPDRVSVVDDEAYRMVSAEIERAMYQYVAQCRLRHVASFEQYLKAKELGVDIGTSTPYLRPWYANACDGEHTNTFNGDWRRISRRVVDPAKVVFMELAGESSEQESFAFERALESHQLPNEALPYYEETNQKGYAWYDAIPTLQDVKLLVDGEPAKDKYEPILEIVDQLGMRFIFRKPTRETEQILWDDLVIAAWSSDNFDETYAILITEDSEWARTRSLYSPYCLVSVACWVTFYCRDDGDSYDTQRADFEEMAEHDLTEILGGALAAARRKIQNALDWNVTNALNKAGLNEVRLFKKPEGGWSVDLSAAA